MTISILAITLWIASVVFYIIWNLLEKNRKLEATVINQNEFMNNIVIMLDEFNALVNKIDMTIWVQSDPELLELFNKIKQIQTSVQQFTGRK